MSIFKRKQWKRKLTGREMSKKMKISEKELYETLLINRIPYLNLGGMVFFHQDDVPEILKRWEMNGYERSSKTNKFVNVMIVHGEQLKYMLSYFAKRLLGKEIKSLTEEELFEKLKTKRALRSTASLNVNVGNIVIEDSVGLEKDRYFLVRWIENEGHIIVRPVKKRNLKPIRGTFEFRTRKDRFDRVLSVN